MPSTTGLEYLKWPAWLPGLPTGIVIYGPSMSGKTTILANLMNPRFDELYIPHVIAVDESQEPAYLLPSIQQIALKLQGIGATVTELQQYLRPTDPVLPSILAIFDDVRESAQDTATVATVFKRGRHNGVTPILVLHSRPQLDRHQTAVSQAGVFIFTYLGAVAASGNLRKWRNLLGDDQLATELETFVSTYKPMANRRPYLFLVPSHQVQRVWYTVLER